MSLDDLDRAILEILAGEDGYLPASSLADRLGKSNKTIYRRVKAINSQFDSPVILTVKGLGLRLDAEQPYPLPTMEESRSGHSIEGADARREEILLHLLFAAPQSFSLFDLAEEYFVSLSTLEADTTKIRDRLKGSGLSLFRENYTIAIQGKENKIRKAINHLLVDHYDLNKGSSKIVLNRKDEAFINEQVRLIEQVVGQPLEYPYNVNIFSHLYIVLQRSRKPKETVESGVKLETYSLEREKKKNIQLFRLSEAVTDNISHYIGSQLGPYEADYLFQYLISSRLMGGEELTVQYPPLIEELSRFFIREVDRVTPFSFNQRTLLTDLEGHMVPLVNRLKNHIDVTNAVLEDVYGEYPRLYKAVKEAAGRAEEAFDLPEISPNEIGYLTIYFAKNLEESQKEFHALVICTSGMGASKLIEKKLNRQFPNIKVEGVASSFDPELGSMQDKVDLIISTIPLRIGKMARPLW